MIAVLDPSFAAALRDELVAGVTAPAPVSWWRRRPVLISAGVLIGLGTAGAAAAASLHAGPGGWDVVALAPPVTATLSGTQTLDLGPRPDGANAVQIDITCVTPGQVWVVVDVAAVACDAAGQTSGSPFDLAPGQTTWTFTANAGATYRVSVGYRSAQQQPWGVNANGESYGQEKSSVNGFGPRTAANVPDLIAVTATNGHDGYVRAADDAWAANGGGAEPTSQAEALARQAANVGKGWAIPVYESDGKTPVGEFVVGDGNATTIVYQDGHTRPAVNGR
jgi:hypothetical protein